MAIPMPHDTTTSWFAICAGSVEVLPTPAELSPKSNDGADGAFVLVRVRDTGIGMSEENLGRLFAAFSQVDSSTTRRFGGTGLGLAISKRLVELMGGIGVESRLGQRSTFWFTVRLAAGNGRIGRRENLPALIGLRVLVVEDNPTNRTIMCHQLATLGMHVDVAGHGALALEVPRRVVDRGQPFQLVVTDQRMPVMDGVAFATAVKADPSLSDLPIILLSSVDVSIPAATLREAGIAKRLTKPVRQSELVHAIANVSRIAVQSIVPATIGLITPGKISPRVLLVEDNLVSQEVGIMMLKTIGCAVVVAEDGSIAVQLAKAERFDLILMDCQMPVMDGFAATAAIRAHEANAMHGPNGMRLSRTPIIALTANAMEGDDEKCFAAGMDDYLAKPYSRQQLANVLAHWVKRNDAAKSNPEANMGLPTVMNKSDETLNDPAPLAVLRQLE